MSTNDMMRDIAELLFEGGAFEYDKISKANPDGFDIAGHNARKKRERTEARVGLATNVIGLGAGVAATPAAFKAIGQAKQAKLKEAVEAAGGTYTAPVKGDPSKLRVKVGELKPIKSLSNMKGKHAIGLAGAGAGLQVANLGGDIIANRVLQRSAKKDPKVKGGVRAVAHEGKDRLKKNYGGSLHKIDLPPASEITWEGEFSKVDSDKRQVFGWASIVKKDGEDVVDLQGDYISIDEVEKSAYDYVVKSRKGGNQHQRAGEEPLHVSDMIESFIVTPEKIEKMGLPDDMPLGWWVGFKINDEDTWQQVKSGERKGFSIHGRGNRKELV